MRDPQIRKLTLNYFEKFEVILMKYEHRSELVLSLIYLFALCLGDCTGLRKAYNLFSQTLKMNCTKRKILQEGTVYITAFVCKFAKKLQWFFEEL